MLPRPSTCPDGWNQVNSDGRCQYSDCFVGDDPIPANPDCFGCNFEGQPECNNGCGEAGKVSGLAPEDIPGIFDFAEGCCNHDYCYGAPGYGKSVCDFDFLKDLLGDCASRLSIVDIAAFILFRKVPKKDLACATFAFAYYAAVAVGGGDAYTDAQAKTMTHVESDNCVAQCPSTQESGGQVRRGARSS